MTTLDVPAPPKIRTFRATTRIKQPQLTYAQIEAPDEAVIESLYDYIFEQVQLNYDCFITD